MDLTGRIISITQPRSGISQRTGNQWMSQDFVLEVPGQYVRHMVFTVFGEDRLKQFNIQQNQEYTVSFDIDAHEYNGRWFNDIRAYNVIPAVVGTAAAPVAAAPFPPQQAAAPVAPAADATAPFPPAQEPASEGSTDDLPF